MSEQNKIWGVKGGSPEKENTPVLRCEACGRELDPDWVNSEEYWDVTSDGKTLCEKCLVFHFSKEVIS